MISVKEPNCTWDLFGGQGEIHEDAEIRMLLLGKMCIKVRS